MTELSRVPITGNGKLAQAMFAASTIPDCWMSETYFKKIGLGRDDIEQVPGITDAIPPYFSEDTVPILGIADRPLNLKIGDCPVIFKIQPFIIEVPNDRFWNQFHFTDMSMRRLEITYPHPINGITLGKADNFRVPLVPKTPKKPEDPYVMATLHLGPNSRNIGGWFDLMERRSK